MNMHLYKYCSKVLTVPCVLGLLPVLGVTFVTKLRNGLLL